MSKSSQESSPITQWSDKLRSELLTLQVLQIGHDTPIEEHLEETVQFLTSATIELMTQIIGEDELTVNATQNVLRDEIARNRLRADLRAALSNLTNKEN